MPSRRITSQITLLLEPEDEECTKKGTVSTFLQSRIHESFTRAADQLYAMGILTTEERIAISSCIGDALEAFSNIMSEKVPDASDMEVPVEIAQEILRNAILHRRQGIVRVAQEEELGAPISSEYLDLPDRDQDHSTLRELIELALVDEANAAQHYDNMLDVVEQMDLPLDMDSPNRKALEEIFDDERDHEKILERMLGEPREAMLFNSEELKAKFHGLPEERKKELLGEMLYEVTEASGLPVAIATLHELLIREGRHAFNKCMMCSASPTLDVHWADGRAHAWFCDKHFEKWIGEEHDRKNGSDIVGLKEIVDGVASKHFTDNPNPDIKGRFFRKAALPETEEEIGDSRFWQKAWSRFLATHDTQALPATEEAFYGELIAIKRAAQEGFRFDPNSTENEGRWRLVDPKVFEQGSVRRWNIWKEIKAPGIQFVMGVDKRDGEMKPQAIRFDKKPPNNWTEEKAAKWWEQNKGQFEKEWTPADWDEWMGKHPGEIAPDYTGQRPQTSGETRAWVERIAFSGVCDKCGDHSEFLAKHRIKPGWEGGEYVPENILNLCPDCHVKTHKETGEFEMGGQWRHDILRKELGEEGYAEWQAERGKERQLGLREMLGEDAYAAYQRFIALKRWHPKLVGDVSPEDFLEQLYTTPPTEYGTLFPLEAAGRDAPKTLAVDLDGTILTYDGFKGVDVFGEPIDGAKETLGRFREDGWFLIVDTCRGDVPAVVERLMLLDIPFDAVNTNPFQPDTANPGKPMADFRIDDSAIYFNGDWPAIYEEVRRREQEEALQAMKVAWGPPVEEKAALWCLADSLTNEEWLSVLPHVDGEHADRVVVAWKVDQDVCRIVQSGDEYKVFRNFDFIYRSGGYLSSLELIKVADDIEKFGSSSITSLTATEDAVLDLFAHLRRRGFRSPSKWLSTSACGVYDDGRVIKVAVDLDEFKRCNRALSIFATNGTVLDLLKHVAHDGAFAYDPQKGILFDFLDPFGHRTQPQDYRDPAYWGVPEELKERARRRREKERRPMETPDVARDSDNTGDLSTPIIPEKVRKLREVLI